jgi:hypothetical protein
MTQFTARSLANALYEGLPTLSNLAETLARQYGKAGALSFFDMMGPDVQWFWEDIARQIIAHSKEWEENNGCACILSKKESERLRTARMKWEDEFYSRGTAE